ncbi:ComEC/Rec2 family competence protein [Flavobacterium sp.]|uniref:ComEC/Rec2 family competence protein n=1 Tax=Flavobacterium sp. TaxID=239 RepID=UPI002D06AB44|nr:ComEC/Rec2 family competence protein [Flavobacterium sp.]HQA73547.1 ComEC/Rec2 family competence protein [Flavobacterium sp.]
MKILQFPLAKITLWFVFGILLFPSLKTTPPIAFILTVSGFCLVLLCYIFKSKIAFYSSLFGIAVLLNSFFIGLSSASIHKENYSTNHFSKYLNEVENGFNATILLTEKLKNTQKNYRYVAEFQSIQKKKVNGKIIFNITKKEKYISLPIGSILFIKGVYYKNKKPFNPNQFDYGNYLEHKEIYGQVYSKTNDVKIIGSQNSLRYYFSNYREKLITNLKKTSLSENSLTVVVALLLGQKHDMSPVIMKEYQAAGAVHILAVSGLHVGIIMYFLLFLLKPMPNTKRANWIKVILIILTLWAFALLAGLSPSIVRSATMFSFLTVGMNIKRTVNIYHTLLVSMLLILLISPSFIYDIGFQLSYLAVFFILLLQPILKSIWKPKNKILNYFWDIITVSTAAQIGVMPLSIYYFHQFPGLFFLTNMIVLPLLSVIMAIGILVLVLSVIGTVPHFLVQILDLLLKIMNNFIHTIASFDSFTFQNIPFTKEMLWLFYLMIVTLIFWIKKPNFKRISLALMCVILLQVVFIYQKKEVNKSAEGIVFNQKKGSIISERIGNNVSLFANDSIRKNIHENVTFQSYLVGNFSDLKNKNNIPDLLFINSKKIVVIDSTGIYNPTINPDILIITQSPKLNLERLLLTLKPKVIIADGSNFKTYSKRWEETCRKQKIPFHNTHEKGFYKF